MIFGGGNLTWFGAAFAESAGIGGGGGGGGGTCLLVSCARSVPELKTKAEPTTMAQASGMRSMALNPAFVVVFSCFNIWFFDLGTINSKESDTGCLNT